MVFHPYSSVMRFLPIGIGVIGAGVLILVGGYLLVSEPSSAALGRLSTADDCAAFAKRVEWQESPVGSVIESRDTLASDSRCYLDISVRVPNRYLHRLIINDGREGVDIARCTVEDTRASTTLCT